MNRDHGPTVICPSFFIIIAAVATADASGVVVLVAAAFLCLSTRRSEETITARRHACCSCCGSCLERSSNPPLSSLRRHHQSHHPACHEQCRSCSCKNRSGVNLDELRGSAAAVRRLRAAALVLWRWWRRRRRSMQRREERVVAAGAARRGYVVRARQGSWEGVEERARPPREAADGGEAPRGHGGADPDAGAEHEHGLARRVPPGPRRGLVRRARGREGHPLPPHERTTKAHCRCCEAALDDHLLAGAARRGRGNMMHSVPFGRCSGTAGRQQAAAPAPAAAQQQRRRVQQCHATFSPAGAAYMSRVLILGATLSRRRADPPSATRGGAAARKMLENSPLIARGAPPSSGGVAVRTRRAARAAVCAKPCGVTMYAAPERSPRRRLPRPLRPVDSSAVPALSCARLGLHVARPGGGGAHTRGVLRLLVR